MDFNRQVAKLAERLAGSPYLVLAAAVVLSALAVIAVIRLPVYTSRQALLPKEADVVQRLDNYLAKFGAASDLILVLEDAPREDLESLAAELAERLTREPEIGQVTARLDTEFMWQHAYLLMPGPWLDSMQSLFEAQGKGRRARLGALLQHGAELLGKPIGVADVDLQGAGRALDGAGLLLDEWRRWVSADETPQALDAAGLLAHFGAGELARGDFASRDGKMLFVFVHPSNPAEDFEVRGPFIEKVKRVAAEITQRRVAAGMTPPRVGLAGLPAAEYEEFVDIQHDIVFVIVTAVLLISALILVVVRSWRWALAIFVPMACGALWSQALVLFTVGHLTIITSGFIAILFGLGADYGIFTSSRIGEERQKGTPLRQAIGAGIAASFWPVLTAGGASIVIFGALATVEFPGFAELGVVAACGVLLILLSTWMVQPALYVLLPPAISKQERAVGPRGQSRSTTGSGQYPLAFAWTLTIGAVLLAVVGAKWGLALPFNYDALALLPDDSMAANYQRRMAAESDYQSEVVIFTAPDLAEARRIAAEAGRLDSVGKVQSLTELFPPDAEERSAKARRLADSSGRFGLPARLTALDREGLPRPEFDRLLAMLNTGLERVDEFQEQAFSAGHTALVQDLGKLRDKLQALLTALARDPERGRERSAALLQELWRLAGRGLDQVARWRDARPLTPDQLPASLRGRFFAADGTVAVYAFPARSVYDPVNLEHLMQQVYSVSPSATGFPATSQAFSQMAVGSFVEGTRLAVLCCLTWLLLVLRRLKSVVLASLPLLIGGGWMLGLMALAGMDYNYANIIALPLVIALAVDYGVWYSHRWRELSDRSPLEVTKRAGKVIALAAGTELAGLGAITLAEYRGISSMGMNITIGLLCCLVATLFVAPAIGQLIDPRRQR
jgi:predicted RND superfamily exporter protein